MAFPKLSGEELARGLPCRNQGPRVGSALGRNHPEKNPVFRAAPNTRRGRENAIWSAFEPTLPCASRPDSRSSCTTLAMLRAPAAFQRNPRRERPEPGADERRERADVLAMARSIRDWPGPGKCSSTGDGKRPRSSAPAVPQGGDTSGVLSLPALECHHRCHEGGSSFIHPCLRRGCHPFRCCGGSGDRRAAEHRTAQRLVQRQLTAPQWCPSAWHRPTPLG